MTLFRLYVRETVKIATLRAHTRGATQEEDMPQTSSKRVREEAGDTEDTGASARRAQPGATTTEENPPPKYLPPATPPPTVPDARSPQQLREEARIAFLEAPLLPAPDQLDLLQPEALLAMLLDGEWAAATIRLLTLLITKLKAMAV